MCSVGKVRGAAAAGGGEEAMVLCVCDDVLSLSVSTLCPELEERHRCPASTGPGRRWRKSHLACQKLVKYWLFDLCPTRTDERTIPRLGAAPYWMSEA